MENDIYKYIEKIALTKGVSIDSDTNLFDTGILDSLEIITLLTYLQDNEGLLFSPDDLQYENFQTINKIINWVKNR